ncbi:hypothetical protein [Roseomonas rosulenta]|uniref:hypothetical protein n=1 Tax=Roseomonas rosulenta TaxID=2748667 RepID=UPI0018DFD805|nr:hypothetical protein [Roseomonas rosulenta]
MILLRLWRGELPLGEAFWTWAVLVGLLVNIASSIGFFWLMMAGQTVAGFIVGHALSLPYNLVAAVGVWRSAGRSDSDPRWAGAARLAVAIGMTILSLT